MAKNLEKEQLMKRKLQAYVDRFNAGDAAGVAALYAEDATVEDPIGSPLKQGRAAIQQFYTLAMKTSPQLVLAAPIRASQGDEAAMAFDVQLAMPNGRAVIRVIDTLRFDVSGHVTAMRAYWGHSDMHTEKSA